MLLKPRLGNGAGQRARGGGVEVPAPLPVVMGDAERMSKLVSGGGREGVGWWWWWG